MKRWIMRYLAVPFVSMAMFGVAHGQAEQADDPSRFPANPEVREADPLATKAAGLIPQSGNGDDIRSVFNQDADRVRLMVLLSPT